MRVEVRKCYFTGLLFEDNALYLEHLKELREQHKEQREFERVKRNFQSWLSEEKKKITSPDMIPGWFLDNQKKLMKAYNAIQGENPWDGNFYLRTDVFEKFEFQSIRYTPKTDNSHCRPRDGVVNWCNQDKTKPFGYPGWTGRINVCLKRSKKAGSRYPTSALLKMIDIHTGSGGGGNEDSSWDVRIFLSDWLALEEEVYRLRSEEMVKRIKGV